MTGDVRQQLIEALDRAERDAGQHSRRASASWVLRLIERDRELLRFLDTWQAVAGQQFDDGRVLAAEATVEALKRAVDLAAAFWLGTPEVGS